jgi:hypothetical protein
MTLFGAGLFLLGWMAGIVCYTMSPEHNTVQQKLNAGRELRMLTAVRQTVHNSVTCAVRTLQAAKTTAAKPLEPNSPLKFV